MVFLWNDFILFKYVCRSLSNERQEFEKKVIATQSLPQETPTEIAPRNDHEQLEAEVQPVEEVGMCPFPLKLCVSICKINSYILI